jgi:hypothetical protein
MHRHTANFVLLLAFFGILSSQVYAQVNLKTGYNLSIISNPGLDRLIESFNQTQAYTSPFSNLRWLHGLEAGLRLKAGVHALEFTYQGAYKSFKANGINSSTDANYTDKMKYAVHSVAAGYQLGDGPFGLGIDLQNQWYKFKYESGQTQRVSKNVQHMMSYKFYLMITLHGDKNVDLAFQPYMVLPTKYYDLQPISQILGLEEGVGRDKWIRYGLTVLFYNGSK